MECDGLGLYFSFFDIDLVSAEDNRDVLTDTNEITYSSRQSFEQNKLYDKSYDASWEHSCM